MSNKPTNPEFQYEVILSEDPDTGELILPIPPQLMAEMGWVEGDTLDFDQDDRGRWVIRKIQ
jgi:hypothetical protein